MNNTLVIMALKDEGQQVFENNGVDVTYTGVGKVNATYNLLKALQKCNADGGKIDMVVNFGTAGSSKFPRGSLVGCHEFIQRDMDVSGLGFELGSTPFEKYPTIIKHDKVMEHLEHGICGSGDSFSTTGSKLQCDVLDMEAYALAKVCMLEKIPFISVKYITDGADEEAADNWTDNVNLASDMFFEEYKNLTNPYS